jgi:basic membrane lipoprotein Med (substrate-binding protein (PBP1-ABC) superfamily)
VTEILDKPLGTTRAEADIIKDPQLSRRLDAAEKKHGFVTGVRFSDGKQHVVSVAFYPKTKFHICDRMADGNFENSRELTQEEYDATYPLRL